MIPVIQPRMSLVRYKRWNQGRFRRRSPRFNLERPAMRYPRKKGGRDLKMFTLFAKISKITIQIHIIHSIPYGIWNIYSKIFYTMRILHYTLLFLYFIWKLTLILLKYVSVHHTIKWYPGCNRGRPPEDPRGATRTLSRIIPEMKLRTLPMRSPRCNRYTPSRSQRCNWGCSIRRFPRTPKQMIPEMEPRMSDQNIFKMKPRTFPERSPRTKLGHHAGWFLRFFIPDMKFSWIFQWFLCTQNCNSNNNNSFVTIYLLQYYFYCLCTIMTCCLTYQRKNDS